MLKLSRAKTGFFLELALGCRQNVLTRLDQAFGQREFVFIGTAAVFLDQDGMVRIEHRHDHHGAITCTLADQPLIGALHAIGKTQLQLLDAEQTAGGDNLAGEDGGFLAHERLLGDSGLLYPAYPDCCPRIPFFTAGEVFMSLLPWRDIDTVLLDMDGTLLDLHFDNHFWLEHLPKRYAEWHGVSRAMADMELQPLFERNAGQLQWYCLDFWSAELKLPVRELKLETAHLIALRPDADTFLAAIKRAGKRVVLITNAHRDSLSLKLERIELAPYFERLISSHDYGFPKENPQFWDALQADIDFDPARSLFIDDTLPILRSAREFGVAHLLAVKEPDSRKGPKDTAEFAAVGDYRDLISGL
ncbi:GMP/IMP nucleotidase YrfG [compost metagenome]